MGESINPAINPETLKITPRGPLFHGRKDHGLTDNWQLTQGAGALGYPL
jgi:hypothetical protein